EGEELTQSLYDEILILLSKRAKERALYLLEDMARTEYQIRKKLKDGFYPDEAIDKAIEYCTTKHYIDDMDYAVRFIESRASTMSKRMISQKLYLKGISKETAEEAFLETEIDETEAVRAQIIRKYGDTEALSDLTFEEKSKLIKQLISKGFDYDSIKSVTT
nr:recombination regulator RecX [Lachnospiraceae bacterium]